MLERAWLTRAIIESTKCPLRLRVTIADVRASVLSGLDVRGPLEAAREKGPSFDNTRRVRCSRTGCPCGELLFINPSPSFL